MKKTIVFIAFILASFINLFSCDCTWGGDFFELSKKSKNIVKVKILGYSNITSYEYGILDCKVLKIYKGKIVSDTIHLRGDDGKSCAPYVTYFKKSKEYIIQFNQSEIDTPWISNCGEYYLSLIDSMIYSEAGIRTDLPQVGIMKYDDFEKKLNLNLFKTNISPKSFKKEKKKENINRGNPEKNYFFALINFLLVLTVLLFIRKYNIRLREV